MKSGFIRTVSSFAAFAPWVVAGVFLAASCCLVSLSWDGSFVLFDSLQNGVPMLPHGRYSSWLLMWPVAWLTRVWEGPLWVLALAQGVMYTLPVVLSFLVVWRMAVNRPVIRLMGILGVLLAALPGQVCVTMEALPVTQVIWPVAVWFWVGCPRRWEWVPWVFGVFAYFLHPAGGPLLALAGVTGAFAAWGLRPGRARMLFTALCLVAAGVAKVVITWQAGNSYEQSQLSFGALMGEMHTGLLWTPFPMVALLLADTLVRLAAPGFAGTRRFAVLSRWIWVVALAVGVGMTVYAKGWSGAINYRKFAFLVCVLLLIFGAWRSKRIPSMSGDRAVQGGLILVWAAVFLAICFQWRAQCLTLERGLSEVAPGLVDPSQVGVERDHALDHWSVFTTALVLEGRSAVHAVLRSGGKIEEGKVFLFETDGPPVQAKGLSFDFSKLNLPKNFPETSE